MSKLHTKMFATYQRVALTRHGPWRREWEGASVFLPWEPHEQYHKAKGQAKKIYMNIIALSNVRLIEN